MTTSNNAPTNPRFEVILFDLDDTLYPPSSGLMEKCVDYIREYIVRNLNMELPQASEYSADLYRTYGSTLAGLVAHGYKCDYDEYNRFIHGKLPYHVLQPDMSLRKMLLSMPQRRIVFTNGDQKHAEQALQRLRIHDCFESVICFETLNTFRNNYTNSMPVICKPSADAIKNALELAKADPAKTLFIDDNSYNIKAAKGLGLWTCVVGKKERIEGADYAIENIHAIKEEIPEIWYKRNSTSPICAIITMTLKNILTKVRMSFHLLKR